MNIEFLIGTLLGVIGIIPLIISAVLWLRKPDLSKLMNRLVDKEISQKQRQRVLRRMNRMLLLSDKRLKKDYIDRFSLGKRGKEAVFEEMCVENGIEPTPEFCRMMLKTDSPAIRARWEARFKTPAPAADRPAPAPCVPAEAPASAEASPVRVAPPVSPSTPPLEKRQTVWLSALLRERFPAACGRLTAILDKHGVAYRFLAGTRDIWCRDYMPVQTASGKLMQFRYDPTYLRGKPEWEQSRSDVREVCRANGITPDATSNINLDGGNVLLCGDRAVISDRVFSENPDLPRDALLAELARLLEAEIVIIPAQRDDLTGHADGMVRFIDLNTLLGNSRADEYKYWSKGIDEALEKHGMAYRDVPFFWDYKDAAHPHHAIGIYVNYLEVGNLLILPAFGVPGNKDAEALERFRELFPGRTIETIDYNEVALEGGLLNCTTWTVYER